MKCHSESDRVFTTTNDPIYGITISAPNRGRRSFIHKLQSDNNIFSWMKSLFFLLLTFVIRKRRKKLFTTDNRTGCLKLDMTLWNLLINQALLFFVFISRLNEMFFHPIMRFRHSIFFCSLKMWMKEYLGCKKIVMMNGWMERGRNLLNKKKTSC